MKMNNLKWISTFFVLSGILLTNLNFYPINIILHATGVVGWTFWGYFSKDKAILTNFGLQIPLFIIGVINYFNENSLEMLSNIFM